VRIARFYLVHRQLGMRGPDGQPGLWFGKRWYPQGTWIDTREVEDIERFALGLPKALRLGYLSEWDDKPRVGTPPEGARPSGAEKAEARPAEAIAAPTSCETAPATSAPLEPAGQKPRRRVPRRPKDLQRWRAIWTLVRPWWEANPDYTAISTTLNEGAGSLKASPETLAEIIKAGRAGELVPPPG
jgi:hypothetical protein